ncbi:MAG: hypothetical protein B6U88_02365 [Candidatus Aenigmarchaeota archaeon ex4484_56]|nr:MAG: hypothetical protein B6U88_02365 [Candidatus Aenigmarchaeota archaeon ex4484_56]
MEQIIPYIEMLRIPDWKGYFLIALLGLLISNNFYSLQDIFILLVTTCLFLGFSFSINNCFDIKEDKLGNKNNPITKNKISIKKGYIFSLFLAFIGLQILVIYDHRLLSIYLLMLLIAFFYSSPPLRFKSKCLLDMLSHGLFFGVFLYLYPLFIFEVPLSLFHYLIAVSIFLFSIIAELKNHLRDYKYDKKAGLKTTVCTLGYKKSLKLFNILHLIYPIPLFFCFIIAGSFIYLSFFLILTFYWFFRKFRIGYYTILSFFLLLITTFL